MSTDERGAPARQPSSKTHPDTTATQERYDRIREPLNQLLEAWMQEIGLYDAYTNPLHHQETTPFATQVARKLGIREEDTTTIRERIAERCTTCLQEHALTLTAEDQAYLIERVQAELSGYRLLDPLLTDPDISEIMVNGPYHLFVVREGRLLPAEPVFDHEEHLLRTIHRLLLPTGTRLDAQHPMDTVRLANGARATVVIPPLAVNGASITITKPMDSRLTIDDLIRFGSLTPDMSDFLRACFTVRVNMIICGGTGSSMTTLLNILAGFIHERHRVVTVENVPTLHLQHGHVVALQCQPPDREGKGGATMRDMLRTATLMRPERIIVSGLEDIGTLEALQLMGRGHDGSIIQLFANTPEEALDRLELMIKLAHPDIPATYICTLIGARVDVMVQLTRLPDGQRKITHITEVLLVRGEGYRLHDVVTFQRSGKDAHGKITGEFHSNQVSEPLAERFRTYDIFLPGVMQVEEEGEC
jgi:pilus assembly protein CpaF